MNKGMFGFPQLYRDESFHGFPKKKVSGESFFGFPSGREDYDFKAFISTPNTVKAFSLAGNNPKITIDWGDGIIDTVVPPTGGITYSHTYAQTGTFNVLLGGEVAELTSLSIANRAFNAIRSDINKFEGLTTLNISGNSFSNSIIPDISRLFKLTSLNISLSSWLPSPMPSVTHCPDLITYNCGDNPNLYGQFPDFSNNPLLESIYTQQAKITGELVITNNLNLKNINVAGGLMTGILPDFNAFQSLVLLDISANSFTGFSSYNYALPELTTINLATNKFANIQIPSFINCPKLLSFSAGGTLNSWVGQVPYFPVSLTTFSIQQSSNANLIFPIDIFSANINLNNITTIGTKLANNQPIIDLSNCNKLVNLQLSVFNVNPNLPQFTSGTLYFNSKYSGNVWVGYLDGVTFDFSNTIPATTQSPFFWASHNFNNIFYPIGSKFFASSNYLASNSMSQSNVDLTIEDVFFVRTRYNSLGKDINLAGNNAAPSGVYQQPAGFNHDLTEAQIDALTTTVKEKIWILVNCQVSSVDTTKRYKWTITTN